jgi:hypothetical protein
VIFLRAGWLVVPDKLACLVEVRVHFIEVIVRLHLRDRLCGALNDYINCTVTRNMRHLAIETLFKIPT